MAWHLSTPGLPGLQSQNTVLFFFYYDREMGTHFCKLLYLKGEFGKYKIR